MTTPSGVLPARLASKIRVCAETGCWLWDGEKFTTGYGRVRFRGRKRAAHRVVYEAVHGPIPEHDSHHGMCVCHTCDVRHCVNPEHLFLGTQADNVLDMVRKGRMVTPDRRGARNGRAKLTVDEVRAIRAARGLETQRETGARFGVSNQLVSRIQAGAAWTHLP